MVNLKKYADGNFIKTTYVWDISQQEGKNQFQTLFVRKVGTNIKGGGSDEVINKIMSKIQIIRKCVNFLGENFSQTFHSSIFPISGGGVVYLASDMSQTY